MNELHVGFTREVKSHGPCLFIADDVSEVPSKFRPKVFDPVKHHFNPLLGIDKRKAQELAEVIYTIYPEGSTTLTVRKGKWELAPALTSAKRLDEVHGTEEVEGVMGDLLFNPVVRNVLCGGKQFVFDEKRVIVARLNRREIGDRAALVLGLFLIGHFKGQLVIPDFGFYGREAHVSLIREGRLIAGVNTLAELTPKLRQSVLVIPQKISSGTTYEDAETLAGYSGLARNTNGYNDFVRQAMGVSEL
jgi:hypothetical protein